MVKRYETGDLRQVMISMARAAIRDKRLLIDAYSTRSGEPIPDSEKVIAEAEAKIRDFKRVLYRLLRT